MIFEWRLTMTAFNAKDAEKLLDQMLEGGSPAAVDAAFAAISPAQSRAVAEALDTHLLQRIKTSLKEDGAASLKQQITQELGGAGSDPASEQKTAQALAQVVLHVGKIRGKEASLFTKAFTKAAAQLSDAEYNGADCLVKPMLAVVDAVMKEEQAELQPNPFRKPKTGARRKPGNH
jgi:hypothetical protein